MNNRLYNCKNPYQGAARRVLCLCSAGMLRSPTIAWVLSNPPYNCNTRAAGVDVGHALIPIDPVLVEWADCFVVTEESMVQPLRDLEAVDKPIYVLYIEDSYGFKDPALIKEIEDALKALDFPHSDCTTEGEDGGLGFNDPKLGIK